METNNQKFKKLKSLEDTSQSIKRILIMGIIIQASVIFGFDEDTHVTFGQTVNFLIKNRISLAAIHVLAPYPGTRIYKELKAGGRLLHENWEHYDHHTVVFRPGNMTPLVLQLGNSRAKTAFNSILSIVKRFPGNLRMPGIYLTGNMGYRKHALKERIRLQRFKSQMQPDCGEGIDLAVGL
jgi:radical SAM superfamily enzyme YgiQ (UPF0313 family)